MRAEKWLTSFVRCIALLERMGNALGTLAFIWATVVVLGGFSVYLVDDFWVATAIVFLEGFRAFSRQSRSDDQFLFKTTGGIKLKRMELGTKSESLYYANAAIMTACVWMVPALDIIQYRLRTPLLIDSDGFFLLMLVVIVHKLGFYRLIGYISMKGSHILLHFSPAAALLLVWIGGHYINGYCSTYCCFRLINYILLLLWFIIYILARFGLPGDGCPYHRGVKVVARLARAILLVGVIWILCTWFGPMGRLGLLSPLVLGNLQTPMALARIMLSWVWLFSNETVVIDTTNKNVKAAVKILYIMVLCQGILYMAACIVESFSFLLRRSLALGCGLVDKSGMESIDLFYEQAYDTFLQESLFDTTKKMALVNFAVDSLNPKASRDKKRAAVRILDSFLQQGNKTSSSETELVSLITSSTKAVTTLINLLDWTVTEDADIRLFAAKVTARIAVYLHIVGIPGTMQKVSSLLDAQDQPITQEISVPIVDGNRGNTDCQQISSGPSNSPLDIEGGNVVAVQASSTQAARNNSEGCSLMEWIRGFLRLVEKLQSIPQEDLKDEDSLPTLGMQILEGLAHDLHNCEEISRATELLPKIIGSISIPGTTAARREKIATSSLKLVAKLASVKGKVGVTLLQELSANPFLIGNLAEILELESSSSYLDQWKLVMDIIAKISMDKKTRQKIGTVQVVIDKLVQEFLGEDESSNPLRTKAGDALAMLAIESPSNCFAMLDKTNYELIGDLVDKLQRGQHVYQAASLLQSLCENSRQLVLGHQGSSDRMSSTLTVVFGGIKDAEGKQMEALIGLASQISSIMSGGIAHILDSFPLDDAFVKKLVGELNARKKPSPDEFPDMRRLLVELTISILESCPRYALIFRQHGMMEALTKVERFMWLVVPEEQGALCAMVAKAKALIGIDTT